MIKYNFNNYKPKLDVINTEIAIKLVKDTFERDLQKSLGLIRVSAPIFVNPNTGLNDDLNGIEKAVKFHAVSLDKDLEIVQSLAKWKRSALHKYKFKEENGLYTDMNAIRPFEETDNIHSLYVDQWDWELVIGKENRNLDYLKMIVNKIYQAFKDTAKVIYNKYPMVKTEIENEITFISTDELEELYPALSRKERENAITKKYKAVFLYKIGWPLKDGISHDGRAADYDDWNLNGDILLWYDVLNIAFEISSMGIRVNKESLVKQLKHKNELEKLDNFYAKSILNDEFPLTIGGGIGQSRLCMYLLQKVHIGEVQASTWDEKDIEELKTRNVDLL